MEIIPQLYIQTGKIPMIPRTLYIYRRNYTDVDIMQDMNGEFGWNDSPNPIHD